MRSVVHRPQVGLHWAPLESDFIYYFHPQQATQPHLANSKGREVQENNVQTRNSPQSESISQYGLF